MRIPFGAPMIGKEERNAVQEVLAGPILVHGPRATEFEAEFAKFTGAPHAVSVSSCTAGMHLFWFAHGLGPGDEVIVPAMTHVATAHAVELTGATPVFVDAVERTGNIDIELIEAAITPKTKGIVVVHYLGDPVDMPRIAEIAERHELLVLEDCALSVGSTIDRVHTGLHGHAGVFSFYPVKHMTTAEGGMVITRDGDLADRIRLRRAFGVDKAHGDRKVPGVYDTVALGFNYRMSEIHAAIGTEQVHKLPDFILDRSANFDALAYGLRNIPGTHVMPAPQGRLHASPYCLALILEPDFEMERAEVIEKLKAREIGSSVYYPHPVPRMSYYREKYGYEAKRFPHAALIADRSIALPVGPHLGVGHMTEIADTVRELLDA